ncbi:MAG: halocyanin domain-containing protein [Haloarculaceae archaeon]
MNRRDFVRSAGGAAGGTAALVGATGTATAQESGGGGTPNFDGWLDDVGNYDGSVADKTGSKEVTVQVGASGNGGNFAFDPPAVHVDKGTTVHFKWTGKGGGHNVIEKDGKFDSGAPVASAGEHFKHTFDSGGIFPYYCEPHRSLGMKGAVVVGKAGADYETVAAGGGGGPTDPSEMGVPFQSHYVGVVTILAMIVSLVFTFFTLKYGESPHSNGGNN